MPEIADALIGQVFDGKYKILSRLGHGGMGSVYQAEHVFLKDIFALKILHAHLASDDEYLQRFQREARTACKIKHPNAITLHDFGIHDGHPYLAMEFIQGETLKAIIKREQRLPLERVYRLITQIGGALEEAHELGVIHRDLKPDNIIIEKRKDGTDWAKILDFGIAKVLTSDDDNDIGLTQVGTVFGTPMYMAPEQALGGEIDTRADLYSVGVILYEMISGKVPYTGKNAMQIMLAHSQEKYTPLEKAHGGTKVPSTVCRAVDKLLEKDPNKRYSTIGEFIDDFNAACPTLSTTVFSGTTRIKTTPTWMKATIAAVIVGLGVAVFMLANRNQDAEMKKRLEELQAQKEASQLEAKQAAQLALKRKQEAEKAAEEAERKRKEAEDALMEIETLRSVASAEEEKVLALRKEAEEVAKQAEETESELERLKLLREEEARRAEALSLEAEQAQLLAMARQKEAEEAASNLAMHREATAEERAKAEQLREEAKKAQAEAVKLKQEAQQAAALKAKREAETKEVEKKKETLQAKKVTPSISTEEKRRLAEAERRRNEAIRAAKAAEAQRLRALKEAQLAEQKRLAAEAAAAEAARRAEEEEQEEEESARRRLPRQGKRR